MWGQWVEPKEGNREGWARTASGRRPAARRVTPPPTELAATVEALRKSRGLNRPQAAERAAIDTTSLFRIEKGERGASREMLERLARALDATPSERDALLASAGFRPDDPTSLLDDPDLSTLYSVLADPDVPEGHRRALLDYVRLAVRHAEALGYRVTSSENGATDGDQGRR